MVITCSLLPYKYGNLPLPFISVNFYGNFAHFCYLKLPYIFQIITLNSHFGLFTPFYTFTRSYIQIHFP